jgi:hypothetical protein
MTLHASADIKKSADLFDHFVGCGEQPARDFKPRRFRSLEVDDQLEFGGLHNRQIGGLLALENPADIKASLAIGIWDACSVA